MSIHQTERERMLESIKPFHELLPYTEEQCLKSNCYAFALGITYPGDKMEHFYPGFTEPELEISNEHDLIYCVSKDLDNLGFKYRVIKSYWDTYPLNEGEYLIKAFQSQPTKILPNGDFHFIRKSPKGLWYHKVGWIEEPAVTECHCGNNISYGLELDDMYIFDPENHESNHYQFVCYFAISK